MVNDLHLVEIIQCIKQTEPFGSSIYLHLVEIIQGIKPNV